MSRSVVVVSIAAFSGSWGAYVEEGGAGLFAREHAIAIAPAQALALVARCAELEAAPIARRAKGSKVTWEGPLTGPWRPWLPRNHMT